MSAGRRGRQVREDTRQLVDQPTDCLVYSRRVQVLPSRIKRETSPCEEQLEGRLDDLLARYLVGITLKTLNSSSASLLAYFHEVLTTSVFFLQ